MGTQTFIGYLETLPLLVAKNGTVETLAYEFDQPYTVSNVQVYWLDFDHYDGDFRVPESWKLYYKEGESWKEVER